MGRTRRKVATSSAGVFINAERLKAAVDRLRQSRASGGMVNFLILKRALVLSESDEIALSTRDTSFQQAITDLTWWPADVNADEQRPFIDVFGAMNAKNYGMKKKKYRSNGPADTLKNGAWSPVVDITEGDRSKRAGLQKNYREGLAELTILRDGSRPMPLLNDAAVWYFRRRDVSDIVGDQENEKVIEERISDAFCNELNLSAEDVAILFTTEEEDAD